MTNKTTPCASLKANHCGPNNRQNFQYGAILQTKEFAVAPKPVRPTDDLLPWAYWMTLFLCILSLPLSIFFLLLVGASEGLSFFQSVTPLLPAAVAWMTLDVLSRARNLVEAQHGVPYLTCVSAITAITTVFFAARFFATAEGSGLALICTLFAAVPAVAVFRILLAQRRLLLEAKRPESGQSTS